MAADLTCGTCSGSGVVGPHTCPECNGSGVINAIHDVISRYVKAIDGDIAVLQKKCDIILKLLDYKEELEITPDYIGD